MIWFRYAAISAANASTANTMFLFSGSMLETAPSRRRRGRRNPIYPFGFYTAFHWRRLLSLVRPSRPDFGFHAYRQLLVGWPEGLCLAFSSVPAAGSATSLRCAHSRAQIIVPVHCQLHMQHQACLAYSPSDRAASSHVCRSATSIVASLFPAASRLCELTLFIPSPPSAILTTRACGDPPPPAAPATVAFGLSYGYRRHLRCFHLS